MPKNMQKAIKIFKENKGILRSSEAKKLGIHPQTIKRMTDRGVIKKIDRGLYYLSNIQIEGDPDMVNVAKLVPKAVFCLLTALNFHEMTDEIPRKIYIAIPATYKKPEIIQPPIEVVNLISKSYEVGIEKHVIHGQEIKIYNKAKTVTDCFKFRKKIGENVAIEALKEYRKSQFYDVQQLLKYAKINRVKSRIETYLRVLQ